jgi:hypothetical protein
MRNADYAWLATTNKPIRGECAGTQKRLSGGDAAGRRQYGCRHTRAISLTGDGFSHSQGFTPYK